MPGLYLCKQGRRHATRLYTVQLCGTNIDYSTALFPQTNRTWLFAAVLCMTAAPTAMGAGLPGTQMASKSPLLKSGSELTSTPGSMRSASVVGGE